MTPRSRSGSRSTGVATAGRRRPTALREPSRSRASLASSFPATSVRRATRGPTRSCSPPARAARSASGTSPVRCGRRSSAQLTRTGSQRSWSFIRQTRPATRSQLPRAPCHRCTRSGTRVASRALLAGESVDEVAFLLGHRDATVTRVVYIREIADARRRHMRRSRMTAEYAGALRIALADDGSWPRSPRLTTAPPPWTRGWGRFASREA